MPMMQADLACCVSQFVARRVIDASVFPEARVRVVLNAVMPTAATKDSTGPELKRAYTAAASGRPLIVCCSRASLEKGLDLLLLAFDRVYREAAALHMPRPFLLYCGGGPDLPLLREMRETLAARDSIVMPGPVTGSHGPLSHAAVAVHYARCEEAFGLFALEAMSAGVPVIVSDRGGLPEVVEASETGLIVPAENAPLLAAAISELLTNAERAHAMGAAGRRRALEVFSMDSMIRTLAAHVIG
jgi:phosphatidylinositol alpha-1,6-mannosyltransferase